MPELLPLDAAATAVGKSEVTLRRLVKSGKVPAEREQTITGFIYRVDPEAIKAYYAERETEVEERAEIAPKATTLNRLAVSTPAQGNEDYWRKRAERYEQKYDESVQAHLKTKEELGLWRGKAGNPQETILPVVKKSKEKKEVAANTEQEEKETVAAWVTPIVLGLLVALAIGGGIVATQLH